MKYNRKACLRISNKENRQKIKKGLLQTKMIEVVWVYLAEF